jgi:hypothetical protein
MFAGIKGAAIKMLGSIMTEAFFMRVLSRLTVNLLERISKSTETTVDDEAIKPIIEQLKKNF